MSNWAVKDLIKKIFQHKRDYNNRRKNKNKEQRQHQHQQEQQEQHQHHQNQQEKHQHQQRQQRQQKQQEQQEHHQNQQEKYQQEYEDSGKYLFKFIYILLLLQSELDIMIFNIMNFTLNQFFKILTLYLNI